jgi:predicted RNA methylase
VEWTLAATGRLGSVRAVVGAERAASVEKVAETVAAALGYEVVTVVLEMEVELLVARLVEETAAQMAGR